MEVVFSPQAAEAAPSVMGLARLAKLAFTGADLAPTWENLTRTINQNGTSGAPTLEQCAALMDMCLIDQMQGDAERGLRFQQHALQHCRLYYIPARSKKPKRTLLGLAAPGRINANMPVEFLLEDSDTALYVLYVVPNLPLPDIPEHDLALVLAAESESSRTALAEMEDILAHWPRPVLNPPRLVPQMGRERLHHILSPLSGVAIPPTERVSRTQMAALTANENFPLIIRPLDSHAGDGLAKIGAACEVASYLERRPEEEFSISPFVDYRSGDGLYRKQRIMFVGGKPYPAHMAISSHWMIHYLNAGMIECPEKRAEESRFLESFERDFAQRHGAALGQIAAAIPLDYFGIDCGETSDDRLLVFEASTALVVHAMDDPALFPYKQKPMQRIFAAFDALTEDRARASR